MEIKQIQRSNPFWQKTIAFADSCSWKAGFFLAEKMRTNEFLDWERVFIAYEDEKIIGFCTLTEKDELPEIYEYSPFIGFVFVDENYRGNRISEQMIRKTSEYAKELGYEILYIMSGEKGLYEKYGFEKIGEYETIFGTVDQLFQKALV